MGIGARDTLAESLDFMLFWVTEFGRTPDPKDMVTIRKQRRSDEQMEWFNHGR